VPVSRFGDTCSHGGTIVVPVPTVMVA